MNTLIRPLRQLSGVTLTIGVVVALGGAVAAGFFAGKTGPEWKTEVSKGWDSEGPTEYVSYTRTVATRVSRSAAGNVSNYHLPLESRNLLIYETDKNRGFGFMDNKQLNAEVELDQDGSPTDFRVRLGSNTYWDLNGDGNLDAMHGKNPKRFAILLQDRWTTVGPPGKAGFNSRVAVSEDGSLRYRFSGGLWSAE